MTPLRDDIPRLRAAIERAGGNITRAARDLGICKPYAMELVREHALNDWARRVRKRNGQPPTGHPVKRPFSVLT